MLGEIHFNMKEYMMTYSERMKKRDRDLAAHNRANRKANMRNDLLEVLKEAVAGQSEEYSLQDLIRHLEANPGVVKPWKRR